MTGTRWREMPVGLDAGRWVTRAGCKTVLMAVHTLTSGQRLLDVARLLENDRRIQVVFTSAPDVFGDGVADFLHALGAAVLPWEQATRLEFDLAVAAAYGSVHELHAPLIVLPHGAGYSKLAPCRARGGPAAGRGVYGLDRQRLVRDGRVVPSAIVLSHEADRVLLGRHCPEALPSATVAGDPCYDRLLASLPHRARYREALGAAGTQQIIVVASTWGTRSLFGRYAALLDQVLSELPAARARVVALLHPNIWSAHGSWQVRAWLADNIRRGLLLLPPGADWRGTLVAADVVLADFGSVGVYGAAVPAPVLLAGSPDREIDTSSAAGRLAAAAPRLRAGRPLAAQIDRAVDGYDRLRYVHVAERITSEPGRFDHNMRQLMYGLLRLACPAATPITPPAEPPFFIS